MTLTNGRLRNSDASENPVPSPVGLPKVKLPKFKKRDPVKQAGEEIIAGYQLIEEAWKKAEAKLALAHVPTDVKIEVESGVLGDGDHEYGTFTTYLAYVKIKNQWRICVITENQYDQGNGEESDCRPITECPVQERLRMFDRFPKLCQEVVKVTRTYVPMIKSKVADFEKALESVDLDLT